MTSLSNITFSIQDAVLYLGKEERTLFRWIKSGRLSGVKQDGKYVFTQRELDIAANNKGSVPLDISEDLYSNLPYDIVVKFRRFMHRTLKQADPGLVICLDRKAASSFCAFAPVDDFPLGDKTFGYYAFEDLPNAAIKEQLADKKKVYIFDEVLEQGRKSQAIKDRLHELDPGIEVGTYALLGRKYRPKDKPLVDTEARICLEVSNERFARIFSQLSKVLASLNDPPPMDKVTVFGDTGALSSEVILSRLPRYGRVSIVPTDEVQDRVELYTLDQPNFFNSLSTLDYLGWHTKDNQFMSVSEGVCKIRLYIDKRKRRFSATAMCFPKIEFENNEKKLRTLLVNFFGNDKEADLLGLEMEKLVRLTYIIYTITSSFILLKLTQDKGIFDSLGLYLDNPTELIGSESEDLFSFLLGGRWMGRAVYKNVKEIYKLDLSPQESVDKFFDSKFNRTRVLNDKSLDIEACRKKMLKLLEDIKDKPREHRSMSWANIFRLLIGERVEGIDEKSDTCYTRSTATSAIDWLSDQASIKTINKYDVIDLINPAEKRVIIQRAARRGVYGRWDNHDEATVYHYDAGIRATLSLCSRVLENALDYSKDCDASGVSPERFMELFVNLEHDLQYNEAGISLFADWSPEREKAIATIPIPQQSEGGFHSLDGFALGKRYLSQKKDSGVKYVPGDEKRTNWRNEYKQAFAPEQRLLIESLLYTYHALLNDTSMEDERKWNILQMLMCARNREITYIFGYRYLFSWIAQGENSLMQYLLRIAQDCNDAFIKDSVFRSESFTSEFDIFEACADSVTDELDKYSKVHSVWNAVKNISEDGSNGAKGGPDSLLQLGAETLLKTIDATPLFYDAEDSFPLGSLQRAADVAHIYAKMLKRLLGLPTKNPNDASKYFTRLVKNLPELFFDEAGNERLRELERIVAARTKKNRDELKPRDLYFLVGVFNSIRHLFFKEKPNRRGDIFLPKPRKENDRLHKRNHFANYLALAQDMYLKDFKAILFVDMKNYMSLSTLGLKEENTKKEAEKRQENTGEEAKKKQEENVDHWDEVRARKGLSENLRKELEKILVRTELAEILKNEELLLKSTAMFTYADSAFIAFERASDLMKVVDEVLNPTSSEPNTKTLSYICIGAATYSEEDAFTKSVNLVAAYAACKNNALNAGQLLVTDEFIRELSSDKGYKKIPEEEFTKIEKGCSFNFETSNSTGWLYPKPSKESLELASVGKRF